MNILYTYNILYILDIFRFEIHNVKHFSHDQGVRRTIKRTKVRLSKSANLIQILS